MKAALQRPNLNAHCFSVASAKKAFGLFSGSKLRPTHVRYHHTHQGQSGINIADSVRACCSLSPSAKIKDTTKDRASLLRRAILGGILLSAGAMPFTPKRFSSASAADLTADKVSCRLVAVVTLEIAR